MTGSNPAFGFAPAPRSNSAEVDKALTQGTLTQRTITHSSQNAEKFPEAEFINPDPAREWEECILQLGQELQQVRENRGISLYQLHSWTHIPLHHLTAIETGNLKNLPPDIYVRGFIRRIGDALGLDGSEIADSLPQTDPMKTVVRSWEQSESSSRFALGTIHLYLCYAAILVAAVAGLTWVTSTVESESSASPFSGNTVELDR